ncbi:transferase [Luteimonas vadosa]|uniref:Transferase n=1 Tax=Luteimonas vadosa TaxID=1165507 RepID=A0ABP9E436_9GAMM
MRGSREAGACITPTLVEPPLTVLAVPGSWRLAGLGVATTREGTLLPLAMACPCGTGVADRQAFWRLAADWLGTVLGTEPVDPTGKRLRRAAVHSYGEYTALRFVRGQTQSRMRTRDPDFLLIDYTRTMLACLLWRPAPACIGVVGLGGGSQVKFCRRHLPCARIEVVENNPQVIALRDRFLVPADDERLQVSLDDGARFVAARPGRYDMLLVDGYDETGIPGALSTQAFYDDCREALLDGAAMSVNLFCGDADAHVRRLRRSFGDGNVLLVEEDAMSNRVAFAWRGAPPAASGEYVESILAALPPGAGEQLAPVFRRVAARIGDGRAVRA